VDVSLIVVGDEILHGVVVDENISFLGARLSALGHRLARVAVLADEPDDIADEIRRMIAARAPLVITSGGLGPTHDDRTVEGVAAGLGVGLSVCAPLAENIGGWIERAAAGGVSGEALGEPWLRKMALAPEGATLLEASRPGIPAFRIARDATEIAILPGPPWMFRLMIDEVVVPQILPDADAPTTIEIEHRFPESAIAAVLDDLARTHAAISIGSYPQSASVLVRLRGPADDVERAAEHLRIHLEAFAATEEGARLDGRARG
jgi:molybdenum cofactor synthesis domain-containing protein